MLIRPDGTAAATLPADTVQNLYTRLYRPQATAHTFPEEVASLVARTPLSTAVRALNQNLLDSLLEAFDAKRVLHTNPLLVPITDRTPRTMYHSVPLPTPQGQCFLRTPGLRVVCLDRQLRLNPTRRTTPSGQGPITRHIQRPRNTGHFAQLYGTSPSRPSPLFLSEHTPGRMPLRTRANKAATHPEATRPD